MPKPQHEIDADATSVRVGGIAFKLVGPGSPDFGMVFTFDFHRQPQLAPGSRPAQPEIGTGVVGVLGFQRKADAKGLQAGLQLGVKSVAAFVFAAWATKIVWVGVMPERIQLSPLPITQVALNIG